MTDQTHVTPPLPPPFSHAQGDAPVHEVRGELTVRLATNAREIAAAQALRYQVFYEEMSARADSKQKQSRRDADHYDEYCDHMLLTTRGDADGVGDETRLPGGEIVVGCYRFLRQSMAAKCGGFYSATEFDISGFLDGAGRDLNLMETGRSCVAPAFRSKRGLDLMLHGIGAIVGHYGVDVLFGCASFEGMDVEKLALPLSYLYHKHRTQGAWAVRALPEHYVEMNRMAVEDIVTRQALRAIPPVLRGYVHMGGMIGDGAVIDDQFNTIDVFVLVPMMSLDERYKTRYTKIE